MQQKISCRIVIVDDQHSVAEAIADVLEAAGFEDLAVFTDPVKALAAMRVNTRPAIVITDFNMPSMTGLELLKEIDQHHPEINGVVITGSMRDALQGSHGYMVLDKAGSWPGKLIGHVTSTMKSHLLSLLVVCPQGKDPSDCPLAEKRRLPQSTLSEWLDGLKPKQVQEIIRAHEACCAGA